jgi:hypothetical protein
MRIHVLPCVLWGVAWAQDAGFSNAVALGAPEPENSAVPLLQDRDLVDKKPAADVCHDFTCQAPAPDEVALGNLLEGG